MRAYHELNGEVGDLKVRPDGNVTPDSTRASEVSGFIDACRVMQQKVTKDSHALRGHWEKYGYRAPRDTQRPNTGENETKSAEKDEEGSQEEAGDDCASSPVGLPPPVIDALRTPQLSDFGLSEMQLKRTLAGAEWCAEVPPMPEMSLPHPALNTPAPPPMPLTPKCALRMSDDDLQTPQMHDFGITEHTMCLNNDFTMDLLRKNIEKPQSHRSPAEQGSGDPESPGLRGHLHTTPEAPTFQTPYVNRLDDDDDGHALKLPTRNGATGSKRTWEYDLPELSFTSAEDKPMPEMPNLESVLGNSLQNVRSSSVTKGPTVHSLELDGPTQEFSLGTPRIRMDYQDPSTPEMPDLSSVTQDICKVKCQNRTYSFVLADSRQTHFCTTVPSKENSFLSVVSESEFQSLPSYLRQMTLSNLNQAVHSINQFTAEFEGWFHIDILRRITKVGTKTPVYILCLTELKRLEHVRGARNTSVYKLSTRN
uniref:Spindle and kinetochore associated complex subunit 3 n=1 Tax=Scophthalmus maximus TaxID=52904 RepID=A0A8D3A5U3_SCOMX